MASAATPWLVPSHGLKYGAGLSKASPAADPSGTHLAAVAGPSAADQAGHSVLSPRSPLLWFGLLAAATVGLMSYSTSVKVGPVAAAVKVG